MSELENALRHPISWLVGAVVSVYAVATAILADPTGGVATVLMVFIDQASTIFTATSIAGFTLAPAVDWVPAWPLRAVALASGTVLVLLLADRLWDSLEDRFND